MSKREKNIEKVARILGVEWDSFSDGSGSWIEIEGKDYGLDINFDGKGDKFLNISISKKEWGVIDESIVETIK